VSVHEQFADDLPLYALGALQGEERIEVERHLEGCPACRREVESLRGDMALLALTTTGPKPPARARQRLLDAAKREPRRVEAKTSHPWWLPLPWLATVALGVVVIMLSMQNSGLRREVASLERDSANQQLDLQHALEVVSTLTASDAMRVTLVAAKTPPQPQGKAIYVRDRSSLIFLASNLPPLPAQKAYELWLIPTEGAPIAAGVFKPDAHGSATVINPPLPAGVQAKAFAITIEPEAGSSTPTMPIVMLGAGE
jgi:anti-sigma-K factor RskA